MRCSPKDFGAESSKYLITKKTHVTAPEEFFLVCSGGGLGFDILGKEGVGRAEVEVRCEEGVERAILPRWF